MTNSRLLTIAVSISFVIVAVAVAIAIVTRTPATSAAVSPISFAATAPKVLPMTSTSPNVIEHQLAIDDFVAALTAKKLLPYKQEQRGEGCGLMGASDCVDLNYYTGDVEVYQFDTSVTTGKDAMEELKKNGDMGQKCYFNKNLAIVHFNNVPKWEQIKSTFSGL